MNDRVTIYAAMKSIEAIQQQLPTIKEFETWFQTLFVLLIFQNNQKLLSLSYMNNQMKTSSPQMVATIS